MTSKTQRSTRKTSFSRLRNWLRFPIAGAAFGIVAIAYLAVAVAAKPVDGTPTHASQAASQFPDMVTTKPMGTVDVQSEKTAAFAKVPQMTVYRSPTCGCCGAWMNYLKTQAFQVIDVQTNNMVALKEEKNVPDNLTSCHTAVIDGYVIEGHVPANDIKRLLKDKPNVTGLSVPGMPLGSPGMEAGDQKESYAVFSFNQDGSSKVFSNYPS